MVVGAEKLGAGYAVDRGDPRITRAGRILPPAVDRRAAAALERRPRRHERDRAAADPRATRSSATRIASAAGSRSSRGSPAGRRSTAALRSRGRTGSSWTSGTSSTARRASTSRSSLRTPLALFSGTYKGATGGWSPSELALCARDRRPLHVRGPARRHRLRVPPRRARTRSRPTSNPLAPALYHATSTRSCRGSTTRATSPRCASSSASTASG